MYNSANVNFLVRNLRSIFSLCTWMHLPAALIIHEHFESLSEYKVVSILIKFAVELSNLIFRYFANFNKKLENMQRFHFALDKYAFGIKS